MSDRKGIIRGIELKQKRNKIIYRILFFSTLCLALLFLLPIIVLINGSLSTPIRFYKNPLFLDTSNWSLSSFLKCWERLTWIRYFCNTFIMIGIGLIIKMFVASTCAFSLSKLHPPFGKTLQALLLCTLILPNIISMIPRFKLLSNLPLLHINLVNTYWPMWLLYSTDALGIFILKGFFDGVSKEMKEAADIDGCGNMAFFLRFMIPLSIPAFLVLSVFYINVVYADFINPLIFMQKDEIKPVALAFGTLAKSAFVTQSEKFAGAVIVSIPMILIASYGMRFLGKGITFSGVKG